MPAALKLQEEFGDTLQTVFVEVGRASSDKMQAFAIDKGWFGGDGASQAIWTKERPFDVGTGSIPAFALMDENGKVLLSGTTTRMHSEIEETIEQYAKASKKAPKDLPKAVGKLQVDFFKGKLGAALNAARDLAEVPNTRDAEVQPAAIAAVERFETKLKRELKRADWLIDKGFFAVAEADLKDLQKGLKGCDEYLDMVAERLDTLESDELKSERAAEDALTKLEKKLYTKGTDKVKSKSLTQLAEKYPGTRAAERAQALVAVVEAG